MSGPDYALGLPDGAARRAGEFTSGSSWAVDGSGAPTVGSDRSAPGSGRAMSGSDGASPGPGRAVDGSAPGSGRAVDGSTPGPGRVPFGPDRATAGTDPARLPGSPRRFVDIEGSATGTGAEASGFAAANPVGSPIGAPDRHSRATDAATTRSGAAITRSGPATTRSGAGPASRDPRSLSRPDAPAAEPDWPRGAAGVRRAAPPDVVTRHRAAAEPSPWPSTVDTRPRAGADPWPALPDDSPLWTAVAARDDPYDQLFRPDDEERRLPWSA